MPLGLIGGGLSFGASLLSGASSNSSAKRKSSILNQEANYNLQNADSIQKNTNFLISQSFRDSRKLHSAQRGAYAASGVTLGSGSAKNVISESIRQGELDRLNIRTSGDYAKQNQLNKANINRAAASASRKAGKYAFGSALLSGGAKFAGGLF